METNKIYVIFQEAFLFQFQKAQVSMIHILNKIQVTASTSCQVYVRFEKQLKVPIKYYVIHNKETNGRPVYILIEQCKNVNDWSFVLYDVIFYRYYKLRQVLVWINILHKNYVCIVSIAFFMAFICKSLQGFRGKLIIIEVELMCILNNDKQNYFLNQIMD